MSIEELTEKVRQSNLNRTHIQRVELLRKANIIDADGYFSEKYFSENTVTRDKAEGKPVTA